MSLTSQQIQALFERGNNFVRMGNLKAAIEDYSQVLDHKPDFAPAYFNRGFARHHGVGDISGAIMDYTQALALKPNFPEAFINRAIAHSTQDDFFSALSDYSHALRLVPDSAQVYVNRGEIHFILGDYESAETDFEQAGQLKEGYRYALAGLAITHFAQNKLEKAFQLWSGLVARNPNFTDAAWVQEELGWHDELAKCANELIIQMT